MASRIFLRLAAQDPYAFERLRRLGQVSLLRVGIGAVRERGGAVADDGRSAVGPEPGFPGDAWLFSGLCGLLVLGCHGALVFLARPEWSGAWWVTWPFSVLGAAATVLTWVLGGLRQSPSASVEALPDASSPRPLGELCAFAHAKVAQLSAHARLQTAVATGLGALLLGVVAWGGVLHLLGVGRTAQWLAAIAVLLAVYLWLDWQPFVSARRQRRLAEEAASTEAMLRRALESLDGPEAALSDPEARAEHEWRIVRDVLGAGPAWAVQSEGRLG